LFFSASGIYYNGAVEIYMDTLRTLADCVPTYGQGSCDKPANNIGIEL